MSILDTPQIWINKYIGFFMNCVVVETNDFYCYFPLQRAWRRSNGWLPYCNHEHEDPQPNHLFAKYIRDRLLIWIYSNHGMRIINLILCIKGLSVWPNECSNAAPEWCSLSWFIFVALLSELLQVFILSCLQVVASEVERENHWKYTLRLLIKADRTINWVQGIFPSISPLQTHSEISIDQKVSILCSFYWKDYVAAASPTNSCKITV